MPSFIRFSASLLMLAGLAACNAPPSVQKVIDEAKAKEEAAKPRLDNPVLAAAQDEGREIYTRYLIGSWAPKDSCDNAGLMWAFSAETFTRPSSLSTLDKPCKLAVVEVLNNGSYAIAGYCPRLQQEDEPVVVPLTRINDNHIIIPGAGGGALYSCQ